MIPSPALEIRYAIECMVGRAVGNYAPTGAWAMDSQEVAQRRQASAQRFNLSSPRIFSQASAQVLQISAQTSHCRDEVLEERLKQFAADWQDCAQESN